MPLSAQSMKNFPLLWIAGAGVLSALVVALAVPNLLRSRLSAQDSRFFGIARNAAIAAEADNSNRKTVQTGSMQLMVKDPAECSDRIRQLTESMGGFLVNSETNGDQGTSVALMAIRIPADRFGNARVPRAKTA